MMTKRPFPEKIKETPMKSNNKKFISVLCYSKSDSYCYVERCGCDCHYIFKKPTFSNQNETMLSLARELNIARNMLPVGEKRSVIIERALKATDYEFNSHEVDAFSIAFNLSNSIDFDNKKFEKDYSEALISVSQLLF